MTKNNDTKDRNDIIILLLLLLIILCIVTTICVWILCRKPVITPDYAPQDIEINVEQYEDANDDKMEAPQNGGAIRVQYSKDVKIDLSEKLAYIDYKNPSKSTHDIILQIIVKDEVIAQSGTIPPGYKLEKLELLSEVSDRLTEGIYKDAKFKILSYNPETREKAMIDAEVIVDVTVQE